MQKVLGHGNVKETSRYLHATEVDIRRAIDNADLSSLLKSDFESNFFDFELTNVLGGV